MRWEGGGGGGGSEFGRWESGRLVRWEDGRIVRWQGGKVVRWQGGRMVRQKGGGYLVLFTDGGHDESKISSFVSDINQGNEGFKIFLRGHMNGKTLLRSFASC